QTTETDRCIRLSPTWNALSVPLPQPPDSPCDCCALRHISLRTRAPSTYPRSVTHRAHSETRTRLRLVSTLAHSADWLFMHVGLTPHRPDSPLLGFRRPMEHTPFSDLSSGQVQPIAAQGGSAHARAAPVRGPLVNIDHTPRLNEQ
ncbi:unnamed protein product, partial [Pleuronectes platessa]